jgi:hypothetical protein
MKNRKGNKSADIDSPRRLVSTLGPYYELDFSDEEELIGKDGKAYMSRCTNPQSSSEDGRLLIARKTNPKDLAWVAAAGIGSLCQRQSRPNEGATFYIQTAKRRIDVTIFHGEVYLKRADEEIATRYGWWINSDEYDNWWNGAVCSTGGVEMEHNHPHTLARRLGELLLRFLQKVDALPEPPDGGD